MKLAFFLLVAFICIALLVVNIKPKQEKSWITKMEEQKANAPEWAKYYVWDNDEITFYKTLDEVEFLSVARDGLIELTWGTVNQPKFFNAINFPPPITKEEADFIRCVKFPDITKPTSTNNNVGFGRSLIYDNSNPNNVGFGHEVQYSYKPLKLNEAQLAIIEEAKRKGYAGISLTINGTQTYISFNQ